MIPESYNFSMSSAFRTFGQPSTRNALLNENWRGCQGWKGLRSERKPSIIFLRRQAVHPLPRGCRPARSRISLALRPEFAFWVDYIALPRRSAAAPSRLWTAGCSDRGGRVLCAGGPRSRPGPRSEAAAVGKVARNPRRVCIAVRRSQRTLADLIAGWIRQPGPTQWLRGAPFFFIDEK